MPELLMEMISKKSMSNNLYIKNTMIISNMKFLFMEILLTMTILKNMKFLLKDLKLVRVRIKKVVPDLKENLLIKE
jgi:hypothetical protein